jgi:hypothetical protein
MPNCSNMSAISTYRIVPDEWDYESNKRIALAAEEAGFDFLFPVSRWRGFGGETDYLGTSMETMTWASALLAVTSNPKRNMRRPRKNMKDLPGLISSGQMAQATTFQNSR